MKYPEPVMSWINRPNERCREEAKRARANQTKPLVESDTCQAVPGDNVFNRVTVPNSQLDDMSKNVMAILGRYRSVLGGPPTNGFRVPEASELPGNSGVVAGPDQATVADLADANCKAPNGVLPFPGSAELQQQASTSKHSVSASSTSGALSSSSSSLHVADSKQSSSLSSSQSLSCLSSPSSSATNSKSGKPLMLDGPSHTSSTSSSSASALSHHMSTTLTSRPLDKNALSKESGAGARAPGDSKNALQRIGTHTQLVPLPGRPKAPSTILPSPKKDSQQQKHVDSSSKNYSAPRLPFGRRSPSLTSSRDQTRSVSPHNSVSAAASVTPRKDQHGGSQTSHKPSISHSPSSTKNSSVSAQSLSPAAPSQTEQTKPGVILPGGFRSTTPTKATTRLPNGVNPPYLKVEHLGTSSQPGSSQRSTAGAQTSVSGSGLSAGVASSAERMKLTLVIPSEVKQPTSKSDLNDILKEMTELQAPLTAIQTPHRLEHGFQFPTSDGHPLSPVFDHPQDIRTEIFKQELEKPAGKRTEITTDLPGGNDEGTLKVKSSSHSGTSRAIKTEGNAGSLTPAATFCGGLSQLSRCSSSSSSSSSSNSSIYSSRSSGPGSVGKTMRDVNSVLRHDLDLSEDSDAEPACEENTSISQSKKGKVMSPFLGSLVLRALSPMSSDTGSSDSSSDSSDDDDDDDDDGGCGAGEKGESKKEETKEKEEKSKGFSERWLSSSTSDSSTSSSSESDTDNDDADESRKEADTKKDLQGSEMRTSAERCDKTPSPSHLQGIIGGQALLDVPNAVSQDRSWGLGHFLPNPKKSSNSPASVSPFKSGSPSTSHSAPPSVQQKDDSVTRTPDQNQARTLQQSGQCGTVPSDLQKVSERDGNDGRTDVEDSIGGESDVLRTKSEIGTPSKKVCESSASKTSLTSGVNHMKTTSSTSAESNKKVRSNNVHSPGCVAAVSGSYSELVGKEVRRSSFSCGSSSQGRKELQPPIRNMKHEKISSNKSKTAQPSSTSPSSIDMNASFTPEKKNQPFTEKYQPFSDKSTSEKAKQESIRQHFSKKLSESSNGDIKVSVPRCRDVPFHDIKHHKRKPEAEGSSSSITTSISSLSSTTSSSESSSSATPFVAAIKASRKMSSEGTVIRDGTKGTSKPISVPSPQHSARTSPCVSPMKSFHVSQSSLTTASDLPPFVTIFQNPDGTNRPQLMIQIRRSFLSKKVFGLLKEKRERRGRTSRDSKLNNSSSKSVTCSDTPKESGSHMLMNSKMSKTNAGSVRGVDMQGVSQSPDLVSTSSMPSSGAQSESSQYFKRVKQKPNDCDKDGGTSNGFISSPERKKPCMSPASFHLSGKTSSLDSSTTSRTQPPSSASPSKASSLIAVKHHSPTNGKRDENIAKSDGKLRTEKRKASMEKEVFPKKTRLNQASEKGEPADTTAVIKLRDGGGSSSRASSRGGHKSSSSRKSNHSPVINSKDVGSNNSKSNDKVAVTNGLESSVSSNNHSQVVGVSINHIRGNNSSKNMSSSSSISSSAPADLPSPYPVETQLHSTNDYLARAKQHKHHADGLRDKVAKYEPYLRSGLSFFMAGYTKELSQKEVNTSYTMYGDTYNMLQYVIRMQGNSSSNAESSDHARKLIVLIIRLQAYLNHRLYQLKMAEVGKLRKIIDTEQAKLSSSLAITGMQSSSNGASVTRTLAPSPHQTNWNRSSTGTPSPMSPTPSPAGSFSSQGSCELVGGKISNGSASSSSTAMTSPSLGMVNVQQRQHSLTQKYFMLTRPLVKALELWDQADAESKVYGDFFSMLDNACGPLTFHSDPPVVVRYMKHALLVLNSWR